MYNQTVMLYDSTMTTTGIIEFETWYAEISDEEREEVLGGGDWDELPQDAQVAWNHYARQINAQERDSGV